MMRVLEFLYTHAPTLHESATLQDAIDKLDLYQVTLLPVLDEAGKVVGIITEKTVFQALFEGWLRAYQNSGTPPPFTEYAETARQHAHSPITPWITPNPPVLSEHDPIEHAVTVMVAHGLDTLPVEGEGRFVGTIRLVDCCQALVES